MHHPRTPYTTKRRRGSIDGEGSSTVRPRGRDADVYLRAVTQLIALHTPMAERTEATFDAWEAGASREEREMTIAAIREALKGSRAPGHFHHH
jgi:hypothetical protein